MGEYIEQTAGCQASSSSRKSFAASPATPAQEEPLRRQQAFAGRVNHHVVSLQRGRAQSVTGLNYWLTDASRSATEATDIGRIRDIAGNTRDSEKHLWKSPIPEYDTGEGLHREVAEAGAAPALGVQGRLAELRAEGGARLTVTIARRELRAWLRVGVEGARVEGKVEELLGWPEGGTDGRKGK